MIEYILGVVTGMMICLCLFIALIGYSVDKPKH